MEHSAFAVRSGKRATRGGTPAGPGILEVGSGYTTVLLATNAVMVPHMATIAYKLRRSMKWDQAKQEFTGDAEANRFLDRARREPWQL